MRRSARVGSWAAGLAAFVLVAFGCQGGPVPPGQGVRVPDGRYAVQWTSHLGGVAGGSVYAQFAFIDVAAGRSRADWPFPAITSIALLTDHGPVAVTVQAVTPQPASEAGYRMFTVLARLDGAEPGRYRWQHIRVSDALGAASDVEAGNWVLDVLAEGPDPWVEDSVTLGGTSLGPIEATLRNVSGQPLLIHGLDAQLPGVELGSMMFAATSAAPASPDTAPVRGDVVPLAMLEVAAGGSASLQFRVTPQQTSTALAYVQLQPFLVFSPLDGRRARMPLSAQVYAAPFAADEGVTGYLRHLPASARAPLP